MKTLLTLCALLAVVLALQPVNGQSGPESCPPELTAGYQAWDDAFVSLLNQLPQSTAPARDALTGHLETGMAFGETECAEVRARYFERVARVYAMLMWTSGAAIEAQDAGATSGCLCHWPSPYMKRKTPTQKWMLGTAIAEVNLRGRDVTICNLEYQLDSTAVWARFERRTFSAAIPQPTGLISFEEYLQRKDERRAA